LKFPAVLVVLLAGAGLLVPGGLCRAVEINGSARVIGGVTSTENGDNRNQDLLNQIYFLNFSQELFPYIRLDLIYRGTQFNTQATDLDFFRKSQEPSVRLVYRLPQFRAFFLYSSRENRSSNEFQDLNIDSFQADLSWTPQWGPVFALRTRKDTNTAEAVAVFGRDTQTRALDFSLVYDRAQWRAIYKYLITDVNNLDTGFKLEQERHEFQGTYNDFVWDNQISYYVDALVSINDQKEEIPQGNVLGEPVPARGGLYVVDTSPDLGQLNLAPDLNDRDVTTPARESALPGAPFIQIGGANTDRNLGLDLGFNRPLTRLLITVDAVSGPAVVWRVYHSPDNFTWTEISGVTHRFDQAFLRYEVSFPQTEDRFFKAVNVSTNSQADVQVTELQAFVEVTTFTRLDAESYRIGAGTTIGPMEGVTGVFNFYYNNDQSILGGLTGRDTRILNYDALLRVELTPHMGLNFAYRLADFEQRQAPVIARTEDFYSISLDWSPMATADMSFLASKRIEKEREQLIRETDILHVRARTDLYPALRLISEVIYNDIDDPFSGFTQQTIRISETMDSKVTERWDLSATISAAWFDYSARIDLNQRTTAQVDTRYRPVPFLTLIGSWNTWLEDRDLGNVNTLNQRYGIVYSPGNKLSLSGFHQDFRTEGGSRTTTTGTGLSYRLNRHFTLFASASRSTTEPAVVRAAVSNVSAGFNLSF